jgi:multisubunit Na+/H+ antiporter MnhB subunit
MSAQIIPIGKSGSTAMRVLEALAPIVGTTAPAVNATFIGQIYIDTTAKVVYRSMAKGSVAPADDWQRVTPLSGETAPTVNATFIGQTYIDTVAKAVYIAVAKGSVSPADDWQKQTAAV